MSKPRLVIVGGRVSAAAVVELRNEGFDGVWVPRTSSTSGDQAVFVDHAAGARVSSDTALLEIDRFGERFQRRSGVERPVRPVLIVMGLVRAGSAADGSHSR